MAVTVGQFRMNLTKSFVLLVISTASHFASAELPFEILPKVPVPKDNPMTQEKIELGRQLFFDPRLSKTGTVSCNSCHNVMGGGEDNRANSIGVFGKIGGRSSPTVWNAAYLSVQFWDGRAPTLEDQAKGPMTNPIEMGMENHDLVVQRIARIPDYEKQFKLVFKDSAKITIENVAKAIATYERTLVTPNSPFDRYLKGETSALNLPARRGMQLVQSIGCLNCHSGANFSGPLLQVGKGFFQKFPLFPNVELEKKFRFSQDLGRFEVTKLEEDKNFWRVPTWRNIALTAPYFHNGSVRTLQEAVRVMGKTQLNKDLSDNDTTDIVAFLESLTGKFPSQTMPRLPGLDGQTLIE